MQNQTKAYLFAISTVIIWSTVASAFKLTLAHLNVLALLFWSTLISTLVLAITLFLKQKQSLLLKLNKRELLLSLFLGFLNPYAYYLILFKAYDLLPAQEAQPLNYTWAITLSILAVPLLKQKLYPADILALIISYCGVVVISTRGNLLALHFSDPAGVLLALGSTVIWAVYWIYNTRDQLDPVCRLFLNFLFGTIFVAISFLLFSHCKLPDFKGLFGACYIGIFEMGITFILWLTALKHTSSTARISILIYISPFLSLILIHYLVGETILPSTLIGLILIVAGIAWQQFKKPSLS